MEISKDTVLESEHRLIEGIRNSDLPYLTRVLHDDLLFILPNGQILTKQMDLESHRRGDMVVESLVPTFEDIRIFGDTAAVVVVYDTKGSMLGMPIQGRFRYIRMWKAFDDGPRIVGGACYRLD